MQPRRRLRPASRCPDAFIRPNYAAVLLYPYPIEVRYGSPLHIYMQVRFDVFCRTQRRENATIITPNFKTFTVSEKPRRPNSRIVRSMAFFRNERDATGFAKYSDFILVHGCARFHFAVAYLRRMWLSRRVQSCARVTRRSKQ